ncbi:MAG: DUF1697 domain-containing protein [Gemmatimonadota bacterium]
MKGSRASRYVAFLRGMNLGRRRIRNDALCEIFRSLGFDDISAFLASGNMIFRSPGRTAAEISGRIESGLRRALGYEVPTFLRTGRQVLAISREDPFPEPLPATGGKLQVALLGDEPVDCARAKVLAMSTDRDRLALRDRELYWLPEGRMSDSELDLAAIETALGPMTIRTRRTLERIAARFLSD